jgi:hypothetical protein
MADVQYRSFEEFYPFYLTEHRRSGTDGRIFMGTPLVLPRSASGGNAAVGFRAGAAVWVRTGLWAIAVERNRPATFQHPLYSLAGDFGCSPIWSGPRPFWEFES